MGPPLGELLTAMATPLTAEGSVNQEATRRLARHLVDTVVIAGYMTQMCCDTTARQAVHLGYKVEFLSDATGTLDLKNAAGSISAEDLQRAILVTQQARFSKVLDTEAWIESLGSDDR